MEKGPFLCLFTIKTISRYKKFTNMIHFFHYMKKKVILHLILIHATGRSSCLSKLTASTY